MSRGGLTVTIMAAGVAFLLIVGVAQSLRTRAADRAVVANRCRALGFDDGKVLVTHGPVCIKYTPLRTGEQED